MKNLFKGWASIIALALVAMVTMVSCGEDDPDPKPSVEDGLYIKGDATALTELDAKGLMAITRNERNQENRATLKEIYIAVSASGGFNIADVTGGVETVYGPGSDFAEVTELDPEEPLNGLWRGSYAMGETQFTVPEDGLYHVAVDTELEIIVVAKVVWGVIGASTPAGWGGSTNLTEPAFDKNMMDFTSTEDIAFKNGDFKFRYSDNWKIYLDKDIEISETVTGVAVNTNFGGAVDALVPGGDNITMEDPAYYAVSVKWELGKATMATMTRGDDLPATDYSTYEMGFVGDGVMVGDAQHNWDSTIEKMTPAQDGSMYTWAWTGIGVTEAGSFKIRQGDDWAGLILGYNDVTLSGSGAGNFSANGDGNFVPAAAGTYNFTLTVDGTDNVFSLAIDAATK